MVRAKFICTDIEENSDGSAAIMMRPVMDGSEENKRFYKYTPGGEIRISTMNPEAAKQFKGGHEYYVDFTPALQPAVEQPSPVEAEIIGNKRLRRGIDEHIQNVKSLPPSRERSITVTKLQEAVMWLGMDLKRINEANPGIQENPYPNSKDPSNLKIEPTADGLKM